MRAFDGVFLTDGEMKEPFSCFSCTLLHGPLQRAASDIAARCVARCSTLRFSGQNGTSFLLVGSEEAKSAFCEFPQSVF